MFETSRRRTTVNAELQIYLKLSCMSFCITVATLVTSIIVKMLIHQMIESRKMRWVGGNAIKL